MFKTLKGTGNVISMGPEFKKSCMTDSQQYPLNHYLNSNEDDIYQKTLNSVNGNPSLQVASHLSRETTVNNNQLQKNKNIFVVFSQKV